MVIKAKKGIVICIMVLSLILALNGVMSGGSVGAIWVIVQLLGAVLGLFLRGSAMLSLISLGNQYIIEDGIIANIIASTLIYVVGIIVLSIVTIYFITRGASAAFSSTAGFLASIYVAKILSRVSLLYGPFGKNSNVGEFCNFVSVQFLKSIIGSEII